MNEIIKAIEETEWKGVDGCNLAGFLITTNRQVIRLGISPEQDCCEDAGYFMTNDNVSDFIGALIHGIKIVDTCLDVKKWSEDDWQGLDGGDVMFVNIDTNRGPLQFTAYNSHNGYYGHEAVVESTQLTEHTVL